MLNGRFWPEAVSSLIAQFAHHGTRLAQTTSASGHTVTLCPLPRVFRTCIGTGFRSFTAHADQLALGNEAVERDLERIRVKAAEALVE